MRWLAGKFHHVIKEFIFPLYRRPGQPQAVPCFPYPLHPPNKPDQKRTAHLPDLRTPTLFVHGASDGFGSPEELREAMSLILARTDLLVVEGAGHDLKRAADLATDILERLYALTTPPIPNP